MSNTNLFQEFNAVSTEAWVQAIEKFLKGKPIEQLHWEIEPDLVISPIQRQADTNPQLVANFTANEHNNWHIGEAVKIEQATDYPCANTLLLEGLKAGANALYIELHQLPSSAELEVLLKEVLLDLVQIHFSGPALLANPIAFLEQLKTLPQATKLKASCALSTNFDPQLLSLIAATATQLPKLQLIHIAVPSTGSSALSQALAQANQWISALQDQLSFERLAGLFCFELLTERHYFVEIARLRAFKRLWLGLMEAYEAPEPWMPYLLATVLPNLEESKYQNMIAATTQAMSAAIAGVDSLYIAPSDGLDEATTFSRRIARNVHHLLQAESYLTRVVDPAAGSYYIEQLTAKITEKAWQQFCTLVDV